MDLIWGLWRQATRHSVPSQVRSRQPEAEAMPVPKAVNKRALPVGCSLERLDACCHNFVEAECGVELLVARIPCRMPASLKTVEDSRDVHV